jgi:putative copper export protein
VIARSYSGAVLSPTASTIRLFLHVLGATVWVGGQIVLGGLVPVLRREAPEATKAVARAFARMAWPAFALLVVTGVWNLAEIDVADTSTSYQVTMFVKVALSLTAAVAVAIHSIGRSKLALALGGAIGLLASLGALFVGVLLRTGLN